MLDKTWAAVAGTERTSGSVDPDANGAGLLPRLRGKIEKMSDSDIKKMSVADRAKFSMDNFGVFQPLIVVLIIDYKMAHFRAIFYLLQKIISADTAGNSGDTG